MQLYGLKEEWAKLNQDAEMSVAEYFTRAKVIWDEIDALGPFPTCSCTSCSCTLTQKLLKLQQDQRLIKFLMKLHDDYAQVRCQILMMSPLPQLTFAYRLLLDEQKHKDVSKLSTSSESMAFAVDRKNFREWNIGKNFYQQQSEKNSGSYLRDNEGNSSGARRNVSGNKRPSNIFYDHCKMSGYTRERCYKLHGYPPGHRGAQSNKRYANMVTSEEKSIDDVVNTTFTIGQYKQILAMLDKEKNSGS